MTHHQDPNPNNGFRYDPIHGWVPIAPPKKRKVWPWVLGLFALAFLAFAGCSVLVGGAVNEVDKAITTELNRTDVVTLEATGIGTVTYSDGGNHVLGEEFQDYWTKDVEWSFIDSFIVQSNYMSPGPVSCRILENGIVVSEYSSDTGMVTCTK